MSSDHIRQAKTASEEISHMPRGSHHPHDPRATCMALVKADINPDIKEIQRKTGKAITVQLM